MKMFESPAITELKRLSTCLDGLHLAVNTQLKEKVDRRIILIHLSGHEDKLRSFVNALKEENIAIELGQYNFAETVLNEIKIHSKDMSPEFRSVLRDMDTVTSLMFKLSIGTGILLGGTMALSLFDTLPDYLLSLGTIIAMSTLLIGKLKVAKMEKEVIKDALNLRVQCVKETSRLKTQSTEINTTNQFLEARSHDIKASIDVIADLIKKRIFDHRLQEEFMVANAIMNQILYHIESDTEGK